MNQITVDLQLLSKNILPESMNYNITKTETLDWSKLVFNGRIHDPDFYFNKLPKSIRALPNIDKFCIELANEATESQLDQILRRKSEPDIFIYDCVPSMPNIEDRAKGFVPYEEQSLHYIHMNGLS
jgi:hypothetical protein